MNYLTIIDENLFGSKKSYTDLRWYLSKPTPKLQIHEPYHF